MNSERYQEPNPALEDDSDDTVEYDRHLPPSVQPPLRQAVHDSLELFFEQMHGTEPTDLYRLIVREVESSLFACVLNHYKGNQTRASACLGISRGTLRKKIREYNLPH